VKAPADDEANAPEDEAHAQLDEQVTDEQVTDEQVRDGQVSDGQVSDGQVSDGQVSDGQVVDEPGEPVGPDTTVECVAGEVSGAALIAVGPSGPRVWLEVAVRPVPAYQRATVAVWVLAVLAAAFALHPLVAPWPVAGRAGLVLAMAVGGRLVVTAVADAVWTRLVESLVLDGAQAVLEVGAAGGPSLPAGPGASEQRKHGPTCN
jgi:hypothetical protein